MSTLLIKLLTWGISYITNALSFFYIGKQNEQLKQKDEQINSNNKANSIRDKLKRDATYANSVRKRFTR